MVASQLTTTKSARLRLGEFIGLADRLKHASHLVRQEAWDLIYDVLDGVESATAATPPQSRDAADQAIAAVNQAKQELTKQWLEIDQTVDELVSQAADEIYRFTTMAESQICQCERHYDRARGRLNYQRRSKS